MTAARPAFPVPSAPRTPPPPSTGTCQVLCEDQRGLHHRGSDLQGVQAAADPVRWWRGSRRHLRYRRRRLVHRLQASASPDRIACYSRVGSSPSSGSAAWGREVGFFGQPVQAQLRQRGAELARANEGGMGVHEAPLPLVRARQVVPHECRGLFARRWLRSRGAMASAKRACRMQHEAPGCSTRRRCPHWPPVARRNAASASSRLPCPSSTRPRVFHAPRPAWRQLHGLLGVRTCVFQLSVGDELSGAFHELLARVRVHLDHGSRRERRAARERAGSPLGAGDEPAPALDLSGFATDNLARLGLAAGASDQSHRRGDGDTQKHVQTDLFHGRTPSARKEKTRSFPVQSSERASPQYREITRPEQSPCQR